jgi:hypothetical protein
VKHGLLTKDQINEICCSEGPGTVCMLRCPFRTAVHFSVPLFLGLSFLPPSPDGNSVSSGPVRAPKDDGKREDSV